MKILLILVDGMRPDAISEMEEVKRFTNISSYTLHAETVFPSVTLPCHMSLFHSVSPDRHGITSNLYTPQVRPVPGLCEILKQSQKRSAFFYNWGRTAGPCTSRFSGYQPFLCRAHLRL